MKMNTQKKKKKTKKKKKKTIVCIQRKYTKMIQKETTNKQTLPRSTVMILIQYI